MFEKLKTKESLFWIIDVLNVDEIQKITLNKNAIECAKKIYDGNFDFITDIEIQSFYHEVILPIGYRDIKINNPFLESACNRTLAMTEDGEINLIYNHKF